MMRSCGTEGKGPWMLLLLMMGTVVCVSSSTRSAHSHDVPANSSLLGDPGMLSENVRVMVEGWNSCNRAGPYSGISPRYADCYNPSAPTGPGPSGNLVSALDNNLTYPATIPGYNATQIPDPDAYAVVKEQYLASLCNTSATNGEGYWSFWTLMLKNGNQNLTANICPNMTLSRNNVNGEQGHKHEHEHEHEHEHVDVDVTGRLPLPMNQPIVFHKWTESLGSSPSTTISSSSSTTSNASTSIGSFYGTYDIDISSELKMDAIHRTNSLTFDALARGGPRSHGDISATLPANTSYFSSTWYKNQTTNSWVFHHVLVTSPLYPWLMLYTRSDQVDAPNGGYPWTGRGVLLSDLLSSFNLSITLNVINSSANHDQFYLPEVAGCWKLNGSRCDGDFATDVTRYVNFIVNPSLEGHCTNVSQDDCPRYHMLSGGTKVYPNQTDAFPYSCYYYWCAPTNDLTYPKDQRCDPISNPAPQELMQLLPCDEWSAHGFPARGEGWVGSPKTKWNLDVGGLTSGLAFTGVIPTPRSWISLEVGPEVSSDNGVGGVSEWEISDWDVFAT